MLPLTVKTVTVELTYRCHRRCAFCYQPGDRRGPDSVALPAVELAERVAQLLVETGCRDVQLSGGEPLLALGLSDFIDGVRAAQPSARIGLLTDGGPLDETTAKALRRRGVGPLQPTLLAGRAEGHDALRGAGAFHQTTRAIVLARRAGIPVTVSFVITRENWSEAAAVVELAFALGAGAVTVARYCVAGAAREAADRLLPAGEQVASAAQAAVDRGHELGVGVSAAIALPHCLFAERGAPPIRAGRCSLLGPASTVTIGPDGAVRSCALSETKVGVLGEAPWSELARRMWEEELRPARESLPPACAACTARERCGGGCRLSAKATAGSFAGLDPLVPEAVRQEK